MSTDRTQREDAAPGRDAREMEKKVAEVARFALPIGTLVLATVAGMTLGPPGVVLMLAGGALIGVIVIFWSSVRTLFGETALSGADAYALGAPRAEEEQKRAVLRALKDLEFERNVGKISDEDYQALVLKYRAEAKRLLRLLDEEAQPRRDQVERLLLQRLRREGLVEEGVPYQESLLQQHLRREEFAEASEGDAAGGQDAGKRKKRKRARAGTIEERPQASVLAAIAAATPEEPQATAEAVAEDIVTRACASCGTINDADAVFCKKCGSRRPDPQSKAEPEAKPATDVKAEPEAKPATDVKAEPEAKPAAAPDEKATPETKVEAATGGSEEGAS